MDPLNLPIFELKDRLKESVQDGGLVVVEAPTGSGKSTQIPQWMMKWKDGVVICFGASTHRGAIAGCAGS